MLLWSFTYHWSSLPIRQQLFPSQYILLSNTQICFIMVTFDYAHFLMITNDFLIVLLIQWEHFQFHYRHHLALHHFIMLEYTKCLWTMYCHYSSCTHHLQVSFDRSVQQMLTANYWNWIYHWVILSEHHSHLELCFKFTFVKHSWETIHLP